MDPLDPMDHWTYFLCHLTGLLPACGPCQLMTSFELFAAQPNVHWTYACPLDPMDKIKCPLDISMSIGSNRQLKCLLDICLSNGSIESNGPLDRKGTHWLSGEDNVSIVDALSLVTNRVPLIKEIGLHGIMYVMEAT
ncbi:Hypothetical predicted protein [Paramuricea clavata]|uniref:Uncharacterized protein n=1 Tax=Paramuricea clavata TaxID=317549 RepID=A0A6S7IQY1_PARCT|nr:Hypothetical predicted protein [Paramuricea clavata]